MSLCMRSPKNLLSLTFLLNLECLTSYSNIIIIDLGSHKRSSYILDINTLLRSPITFYGVIRFSSVLLVT